MVGLCVGQTAKAENLILYSEGASGAHYYYDSDSIKRSSGMVYVWIYRDNLKNKPSKYARLRIRYRINCNNEAMSMGSTVAYNADGSVAVSTNGSAFGDADDVVPGTPMESLYNVMCKTL